MTFQLKYSEVLQGSFKPDALNLIMVFQVNCPGCFLQGFPQMIRLHAKYQGRISCFALSTAFEDFNLNTTENTKLLLEENYLTGETRKAFNTNNLIWNQVIPFPVLVDVMIEKEVMLQQSFIDRVTSNHAQFSGVLQSELVEIKTSLHHYFNHYQKCGFTFASNLLQGTPTFVLFNSSMDVLLQWFGHLNNQAIEKELNKYLS
jgi:hypothetical protein